MRTNLYPTATDTGWLAEVKAGGVARVAAAWGLEPGRPGTGGRSTWQCPACGDLKRHPKRRDKRGAIGPTPDGLGWRCHQCDASGDAVTLAAWLVLDRGRWGAADVAQLRQACADRGLCEGEPGTPRVAPPRPLPAPPPPVAPAPVRPPAAEVAALWDACERLAAVPSWEGGPAWCGEPRRYLADARRMDVATLAALDVARILPPPERFTFPTWWPAAWADTWRLVVPAYEPTGELSSIHARAVVPHGEDPKVRWPRGPSAGGLLLACPLGVAFLRGELPAPPPVVVVVEGLTDTLSAVLRCHRFGRPWPVLGVASGSARAFERVRWPSGVVCHVRTDPDATGDRYAAEVRAALHPTVRCLRMRLTEEES